MKMVLTVDRVTAEKDKTVVRFQPDLADKRDGDIIDGELFLTTKPENAVLKFGDIKEIELIPVPSETTAPTDSATTTETPTA